MVMRIDYLGPQMLLMIDKLKSESRYHAAGSLAYALGRDDSYGCHFGMRSELNWARSEFRRGWHDAMLYCEVSFT